MKRAIKWNKKHFSLLLKKGFPLPEIVSDLRQEVSNLSLLIQKNVTYRRIAYFCCWNTELKNYKGASLWRYKDNMRLFQPLKTKLINKFAAHGDFFIILFSFTFTSFMHHVKLKWNSQLMPRKRGLSCHAPLLFYSFTNHTMKKGPITPSHHAPLSCHPTIYFAVSGSHPEKRANHTTMPTTGGVLLQMIIHPNLHESSHMLYYEKGNQHEFEGKSLETDITTWSEFSNGLKSPQNKH